MFPFNSFVSKAKDLKLVKLPIPLGILPLIPHSNASNFWRDVERLLIEAGRKASNGFRANANIVNFRQFVKDDKKFNSELSMVK